ncbi:putative phosphatase phospho1 [Phytophthora boehmeriae]|uniref:Putative phosphatase phospho1 n=1 Tax=Phytophthora boehmeriae TaxID=109152 RepID=A0A8T1X274_9STRA|nr:putative phosphatase phospho1 [Phytophthora boehmeriae]
MPQNPGRTLIVFDFDESLVNADSDTFVFECFHPELLQSLEVRHAQNPVWPTVFDDMHQILADEKPTVTSEMIKKHVAQIPIQERMADAIRMAVDEYNADVKIISDGNTIFIKSVLEHQGLQDHVSEVFTNPAEYETMDNGRSRLRIHPFHPENIEPLGCELCPTNLCKSRVLESIRKTQPHSRVIYVGDGVGDFCPATHLTKNDIVCARADASDGRSYGLLKRINSNPEKVKAPVVAWSTGEDIYRVFSQAFSASS